MIRPPTTQSLRTIVLAVACSALLAACGSEKQSNSPEGREIGDGYAGVEQSMHPTLEIPAGSPKVVVLGDSLAAGLHLDPSLAWPAALQRKLFERGLPFQLINAGVSGDTSRGGLARLPWQLKSQPDIVVVELGANESLRGQVLSAIESNLREIIETIRAAGAKPVLIGMDAPPNLEQNPGEFAAMYVRLGEELDVPLVERFLEGVGGEPDMNLPDGLHPTPEGHERLAENAAETVATVIRSLEPGD